MSRRTVNAFRDDALSRHDAVAVADLVRRGEISAREAVSAAIERCQLVNPEIAAVAEEDFERARNLASSADVETSGPFFGVPTFIKDLTPVAGLTTRFGSHAFDRAVPATKNGLLVQQMFDMGLINLGTSTLPEFGFTPSAEFPDGPPTRNPWNLDRSAGGSSGGAAALVASGVVPMAHAADGGGSIRIPASCCGLVGLKSSRGRLIQASDAKRMPVNIVVEGVLTRSVRDTALFFAEAERRYRNPRLAPVGLVDQPVKRSLRIGTILHSPTGAVVDEPTRRTFDETTDLLTSLGHEVFPIPVPVDEQFVKDFSHLYATLGFLVDRLGRLLFGPTYDRAALTELTKGLSREFAAHPWRTPGAVWRLRRSAFVYEEAFKNLDVVLSPVVAQVPPAIGHLGMHLPYDILFPRVIDWASYSAYCNATGGPSASLPLGHDGDTNCPIGMMFSAALGQERLLLELAFQLEAARPWAGAWVLPAIHENRT